MDWMNDQFHSSPAMLSNATLGRTWLMQADSGARQANDIVSIQMCMALCRQIMQSVEMLSVTNARASNDYHPGNDQWEIVGTTSILTHALRIAPSKDLLTEKLLVQYRGSNRLALGRQRERAAQ